nr:hypothetical protein HK105_006340 [Polyrhizophydium stewartii]
MRGQIDSLAQFAARTPETRFVADGTLKTDIVILSEHPLDWCKFTSSAQEAESLARFVAGTETPQTPRDVLMHSTFHWRYPGRPIPPSAQRSLARSLSRSQQQAPLSDQDRLELKDYDERQEEWCDHIKAPHARLNL